MGEVLAGHDDKLNRPVAIKRLRLDHVATDEKRQRLQREAQLSARLSHPNVVQVYDFVSTDDADHIVIEYVEGQTLDELTQSDRPSMARSLEILAAIARGLDAAHGQGIIHRDLKLDNVIVGRDGQAKIVDFGIAAMRGDGETANARGDLLAFGALAYELLVGQAPLPRGRTHRPLIEAAPAVPTELSKLVERMLDERPELRPASAREVQLELEVIAEQVERARRDTEPTHARAHTRQVAALALIAPKPTGEIEQAVARLAEWQRRVRAVAARYQAHVVVSTGREALLCVGYPRVHGDNCAAATTIVAELSTAAAGIAAGRIVILDQPDGAMIVGEPIDLAVELGRRAKPGSILVTAAAQRILSRSFRLSPVESDGSGPAVVYRVDEPLDWEARGPMVASPFVGREDTLEAIRRSQASVFGGDGAGPRGIVVLGSPGAGKSRLVRSVLAETNTARVFFARGNEQLRAAAFGAFAGALHDLPELRTNGRPADRDAVVACVAALPSSSREMTAVVAHVLGVQNRDDDAVLAEAAPYERHSFVADQVARFLVEVFAENPTLVVVEDVALLDTSSLDVVVALGAYGRGQPLFILATSRPTASLAALPPATFPRHELPPLAPDAAARLVKASAGGWILSPAVTQAILERAAGIPLVVEELTQFVAHRAADASGATALEVKSIPTTFADAVLERFQDLPAASRRVAELAASIGNEVDESLLSAVTELRPDELAAHVELLSREGFLHGTGFGAQHRYAFRHALTRDVIYDVQDAAQRRVSHRAILVQIDRSFADWDTTKPDLVAQQCEGAGELRRAVQAHVAAGAKSVQQWSPGVARQQFEAGLRVLGQATSEPWASDAEIELRRAQGPVLSALTGWGSSAADANNARLRDLSTKTEQPLDWTTVHMSCLADLATGAADELSSKLGWLGREVDAMAPGIDSDLKRYLLRSLRGLLGVFAGYPVRARGDLEAALAQRDALLPILRTFPLPEPMITPRLYLAWCELLEGNVPGALEIQRAEEALHEPGSLAHDATTSYGGALAMAARAWDEARVRAALVVSSEATKQPTYHGMISQMILHLVELRERSHARDVEASEVERLLGAARSFFDQHASELRMRVGAPLFISFQADTALTAAQQLVGTGAGSVAARHARVLIDEMLALTAEGNVLDRYVVSETFRLHGELSEIEGRADEARRALAEAKRRARLVETGPTAAARFYESLVREPG